jgi:hypothetical protein
MVIRVSTVSKQNITTDDKKATIRVTRYVLALRITIVLRLSAHFIVRVNLSNPGVPEITLQD